MGHETARCHGRISSRAGRVPQAGVMQLELHQLDRRYEALRRRSPKREQRLLASLAGDGQQMPVVIVGNGAGGYVLVDGYKRVRALAALRQDVVDATQWTLPERDALILERLMRTGEEIDALEQGWLLSELNERFGMSEDDLARRFDKSKSWVSRRMGLVTVLPESVQERVLDGLLGAHAAMKYLLPLARANEVDCLSLIKALGSTQPTTRQLEALYVGLTSGTAKARELILSNPWLYLRSLAEAERTEDQARTPAEVLLGDIGAMGGIARRAHKFLSRSASHLPADERTSVRRIADQVRADIDRLFRSLDEVVADAG